ncbi:MAG: Maf family protein [bacterium]
MILASRSPQRLALLRGLGLEVEVFDPDVAEQTEGDPIELVRSNAVSKALAVGSHPDLPEVPVVAGDTEVVLDDRVLGQPSDASHARRMLIALSGGEHLVVGAICIVMPGEDSPRTGVEQTTVRFRDLTEDLIDACVAGGEWAGRAGGYAVQGTGSALVERIEGDLSNVIGFPLGLLARLAPELLRSTRQN